MARSALITRGTKSQVYARSILTNSDNNPLGDTSSTLGESISQAGHRPRDAVVPISKQAKEMAILILLFSLFFFLFTQQRA
jgi:hypothetical protein